MRILAFDIGGTFIKYALCNDNFELTEKNKIPTNAKQGGQVIIQRIIDIIESYENIDRVAISTAGQVDSEHGVVVYSTDNIPYYTGMMVKSLIENKTGIPTFVENDVNAAALGEAHFGAAKGENDFICLTLGTGVGGAIFLNNKLYKGSASAAGEIGHMVIHAGGRQCTCGGEGCFECYASANALIKAVNKISDEPLDAFQIFQKENMQRPEIRSEIDKWIDEIIIGLMNLIYIFNPPLIVIGGGIMNEDYIIELIDRKIYSRLMKSFKNVRIERSQKGNDSALLGVAYEASKL
ncbi:ROK family protein [uncultured Eubacterium sp.]|uniref:ROK family protein n=1 Tax=uncultured Eubacterium sp. TaxID=165185 RepID=UPI0025E69E97|nr:ROK family protein [uncultured Eubacterium sp.]